MASSSSSHQQNEELNAFPVSKRRKISESSRLFDVFINHRAPDVKQTLATQLYNSLQQLGIRAFLDSEKKELKDSFPSTIETAIRSAKVHIPIFSKRYAESPWCLAQLILMLESTAKIIPVFYEVKPSDLRYIETGVYAEAFIKYEEKGSYLDKLNAWKEALRSLSRIPGEEFYSDRDCQKIVAAVQKEVQRNKCLHVAKYPVGLKNLVEDFEKRCLDGFVQDFEDQCGQEEKHKAQVVGIFGMGGIGKTTLAKELFNQKCLNYERASFLLDVREKSVRSQLSLLQGKLAEDLFRKEISFTSTEEGTVYLKDCLQMSPPLNVLIVIDGVDHVEQLNALVVMDILKHTSNSLVIVTTRDVGVLKKAGITVGYNLKGMGRIHARELFCWHAFGQADPVCEYEVLVDNFVDMCGGLPLSLQVFGAYVQRRKLSHWRSELIKASKMLPGYVKQTLRISFDPLDNEEKQMFMDTACFFLGKPKSIAERLWEASGWDVQLALGTLKDRCLVEEIEDHTLRMHDHLRDLGREMAAEFSSPHRLWRPQEMKLLESKGFNNILTKPNLRCFNSIFDKSMGSKVTYFLDKSDSYLNTPGSLLWLQLEGNSKEQPSIPSWIPLQKLQCLKIKNGRFEKLWKKSMQAPSQLKELEISQTVLKEIPDFSGISDNLENVFLDAQGLPIKGLPLLESLNMNLCNLYIRSSTLKGEQVSTKRGEGLCESLVIQNFTFSREVYWNNGGMSGLEKLEIIDEECVYKILISGVHYPSLKSIKLHYMKNLVEVDLILVKTLNCLEIANCESLESVRGISDLAEVKISDCGKLKFDYSWDDKEHASKLRELTISGTWSASFEGFPSSISCLNNLKKLALLGDAGKQFGIKGLPEEFCDLHSLEHLELRHCKLLASLPARFGYLRNLRHLNLSYCKALRMLPVYFQRLELLNHLDLSGCKRLLLQKDNLENLKQLENLYLSGCLALQKIPHQITDHACLRELKLQHTLLEDLPSNIGQLSKLEVLTVGSPLLKSLPDSLGNLSSLKSLSITNCFALKSLPKTLGDLVFLEHLCIESTRVSSLPEGFGQLANLRTLKVSDCRLSELNFGSVSSFSLEKLTEINLSETLVTRISISDEFCPRLETLRLSKNDSLEVIETLPATVKSIELSDCEALKSIKAIRALPIPPNLTISDCPKLEKPLEKEGYLEVESQVSSDADSELEMPLENEGSLESGSQVLSGTDSEVEKPLQEDL